MVLYVLADATGRITQTGNMGDDLFETFNPPGMTKVVMAILPTDLTSFIAQNYVNQDGQVVSSRVIAVEIDKPMIRSDGEDIVTLSGLPQPCTVTVSGAIEATATVEGGTLEISCDHPGELKIRITADPEWLAWEGTIHAT